MCGNALALLAACLAPLGCSHRAGLDDVEQLVLELDLPPAASAAPRATGLLDTGRRQTFEFSFPGGALGAAVQETDGMVLGMLSFGLASEAGVHQGWYILRINSIFQFTKERLLEVTQDEGPPYNITFTDSSDTVFGHCADAEVDDRIWVDDDLQSCQHYKDRGWCTRSGRPTQEFLTRSRCQEVPTCDFQDFVMDGLTARDACCDCGGGSWLADAPETVQEPTPEPTPELTSAPMLAATPAPTSAPTPAPTPERTPALATTPEPDSAELPSSSQPQVDPVQAVQAPAQDPADTLLKEEVPDKNAAVYGAVALFSTMGACWLVYITCLNSGYEQ